MLLRTFSCLVMLASVAALTPSRPCVPPSRPLVSRRPVLQQALALGLLLPSAAANAADKPSTKTPIINTAGGVASQSATNQGGEHVHTGPGSATVRDGAGDVKYIPGRK